jgi:hypothetical protein
MVLLIQVNTRLFTFPYKVHQKEVHGEVAPIRVSKFKFSQQYQSPISVILVIGIHTKISRENLILAYTVTVLSHVRFEAPIDLFFFNWRIVQGFVTRHKLYLHNMLIYS